MVIINLLAELKIFILVILPAAQIGRSVIEDRCKLNVIEDRCLHENYLLKCLLKKAIAKINYNTKHFNPSMSIYFISKNEPRCYLERQKIRNFSLSKNKI